MKLGTLLHRASVVLAAFIGSVVIVNAAMTFSTGTGFLPGPRLIDGSDLNVIVSQVNGISTGTAGTFSTITATGIVTNAGTTGGNVNGIILTPAVTGVSPSITAGGPNSDTNFGLVISAAGSAAVHLGGTTAANGSLRVPTVASAVNQVQVKGSVTSGVTTIDVGGTAADTNAPISLAGAGTGAVLIGGATTTLAGLQVAQTASRVNDVIVTPAATGNVTTVVAGGAGADAGAVLALASNGTGALLLGGATTTLAGLQVAQTASRVNDIVITPGATGTAAIISEGGAGADANRDLGVSAAGTGIVALGQVRATCSGTTTATCQGQRFTASVTGLTTAAAGTTSAAMTVTNASVASSAVLVHCQVNGYAGTGVPIATTIIPGTGSVSFTITNVAGSGALNATVPVACVVF